MPPFVPPALFDAFFASVAEFVARMSSAVFCGMKAWFCWLADSLIGGGITLLDIVLSALPHGAIRGGQGGLPLDLSPVVVLLPAVNAWFPMDYAIGLVAAYFTFSALFITAKLVLKLIPTVG